MRPISIVKHSHLFKPNILKPHRTYPLSTRPFYYLNNQHLHSHRNARITASIPRPSPLYISTQIQLNKRSTSVNNVSVSQKSIRTFFGDGGDGGNFDYETGSCMAETERFEEPLDEASNDEENDPDGDGGPDPQVDLGDDLPMDPLVTGLLVIGGLFIFGFVGLCCVMAVLSVGMGGREDGRKKRKEEERVKKEERREN